MTERNFWYLIQAKLEQVGEFRIWEIRIFPIFVRTSKFDEFDKKLIIENLFYKNGYFYSLLIYLLFSELLECEQ